MKKVIFKWVSTVIDYETEDEAKKDIERMKKKGMLIVKSQYTCNQTFEQGKGCYTVEVWKRYNRKYEAGF